MKSWKLLVLILAAGVAVAACKKAETPAGDNTTAPAAEGSMTPATTSQMQTPAPVEQQPAPATKK